MERPIPVWRRSTVAGKTWIRQTEKGGRRLIPVGKDRQNQRPTTDRGGKQCTEMESVLHMQKNIEISGRINVIIESRHWLTKMDRVRQPRRTGVDK